LLLTPTGPEHYDTILNQWMSYDFPGTPIVSSAPNTTYFSSPVRYVINNMTYRGSNVPTQFSADLQMGKVTEFQIGEMDKHAWHMHVTPVQFMTVPCDNFSAFPDCHLQTGSDPGSKRCMRGTVSACHLDENQNPVEPPRAAEENWGGFWRRGDWADTIMIPHPEFYDVSYKTPTLPASNVRFLTDCYAGSYLIQCHVLHHADQGMMMAYNVLGPDHTCDKCFKNEGTFETPPPHCLAEDAHCARAFCTEFEDAYSR